MGDNENANPDPPAEETPAEETPAKEGDTPAEETPAKDGDTPAEETPEDKEVTEEPAPAPEPEYTSLSEAEKAEMEKEDKTVSFADMENSKSDCLPTDKKCLDREKAAALKAAQEKAEAEKGIYKPPEEK